ncbi:GNAT family N-acetyltransferase [Ancylobacter polymorphus]|uniref:Microcystin-dependent protein/RimJ/RimL family protein N-acetyltransferase n=1 Tax=Ancylobacter polymorphus TaxID=223390 RepID=A0ABU0B5L4_9HYPH|nr:GNAT family N-acetyltransferase [Ancylobacter polymorphus]MDQ0301112.1 microcystin-dependent protein/RimJ/RimL family protein N-acetyltransferase [Ancylobacter polymorphus]
MSDPYLGEIRMFAGIEAPDGWLVCDGRKLPVAQYRALFAILGKVWGGDGVTTFALPDFRGRVPVGDGPGPGLTPRAVGSAGGIDQITFTKETLPPHRHALIASKNPAADASPDRRIYAATQSPNQAAPRGLAYITHRADNTIRPLRNDVLTEAGGNGLGGVTPHSNMMPSLAITFIIATFGEHPSDQQDFVADPYMGEIRIFAFPYPPEGWADCAGAEIPTPQNEALYSILGTTYGTRDGHVVLPNLAGRVPLGQGTGAGLMPATLGKKTGTTKAVITLDQVPQHNHVVTTAFSSELTRSTDQPSSATYLTRHTVEGTTSVVATFIKDDQKQDILFAEAAISETGGGEARDNRQPYLALRFCIALEGVYPYMAWSASSPPPATQPALHGAPPESHSLADGIVLREETPADMPFLAGLYTGARGPTFDGEGWPEEQRRAFFAEQYRRQVAHYTRNHAGAALLIIERHDVPIGRLYLHRGPQDHRIIDFSLIPEARNRGYGGIVLDWASAEAAALGCSTSIQVGKNDPARRLYERKGFIRTGDSGPYWLLTRSPTATPAVE